MTFEWDPAKAASNLAKHRVSFELAQLVWNDPLYVLLPDRNDPETGEQRWHAIGTVGGQALLLVVHTYPNPDNEDHVRIIGARKATSHERKRYEAEL
ncbi:MAG: BrnT family toxin [Sphingomonadales bacterium]|nr:BrnT family toxin [Sphingomonadales bacterium]